MSLFNGHTVAEWETLVREGADSFIAWASALPPEERAEALRAARDVLARKAAELAGAEAARPLVELPIIGASIGS